MARCESPLVCLIRVPSRRMWERLPASPSHYVLSLTAQEGSDVVRLDCVNRRPRQVAGDLFTLLHAPGIVHPARPANRAVGTSELVSLTGEPSRLISNPWASGGARYPSAISTKAFRPAAEIGPR